MAKNIKPTNDRILVKPIDEGEKTYGSIVIPDMGKEKPEIGKVLAVGPGRITPDGNLVPNQIKVGQTVLVPKFGAQTMTVENETYIMASENDVLGTLNIKENDNE